MITLHKRSLQIVLLLLASVLILSTCISHNNDAVNGNKDTVAATNTFVNNITYIQFAGSQVCASCHKDISSSYAHTAHFLTSQIASQTSVKGSFAKGKNSFLYDSNRVVFLEKKEDSLYQVYYFKGDEHVRRRFNVVMGSGTKGQTYLSWVNHQLIELPVSYFTQVNQWANSPGYPLYPTLFNRPATTRCLECHSTFAATLTPPMQEPERFDSTKMILGITCERCHGPAAAHVAYEKQNPGDTVGKFIINLAKLSRQQNLDFCSLCHSGRLQKIKPSFSFVAGDTLANFFAVNTSQPAQTTMDVHGNQYGLLASSQCFLQSKTMTCLTCHNVHTNERGNKALFSQRCMTCHTEQHKAIDGLSNNQLIKNCVDCHMPVQSSHAIEFLLSRETTPTPALMRTHYITVYDEETRKFIEKMKAPQKHNL